MLKEIRFRNWRSCKDVTISDLRPITVLIGANSSGKSNIVLGLDFLRRLASASSVRSTLYQADQENHLMFDADFGQWVELGLTADLGSTIQYDLKLRFAMRQNVVVEHYSNPDTAVSYALADRKLSINKANDSMELTWDYDQLALTSPLLDNLTNTQDKQLHRLGEFLARRWQLLAENFLPLQQVLRSESGDPFLIEPHAHNTVTMLSYMDETVGKALIEDARYLLSHLASTGFTTDNERIRLLIEEKVRPRFQKNTLSAGTGRLIAMLTAYYALDMRDKELPGLVMIEEPDTAIHPQLLGRFVDLLRSYSQREEGRQFILTTHNPHLIDFFEPEEVRLVKRDEHGFTHVEPIPQHIREIWLDKYTLGDVWLTNAFGDND